MVIVGTAFFGLSSLAAPVPPLDKFGHFQVRRMSPFRPTARNLPKVQTHGETRNLVVALLRVRNPRTSTRRRSRVAGVEGLDDDNRLATISTTSSTRSGFSGATREWYQRAVFNFGKLKINALNFAIRGRRTFNVVIGGPGYGGLRGPPIRKNQICLRSRLSNTSAP